MSILKIITDKIKELSHNYIAKEVQTIVSQISKNNELRHQKWGLDQTICDLYLRCPNCRNEQTLEYNTENITCNQCGFNAEVNFGIPCLIKPEEIGIHSHRFLNRTSTPKPIKSPHKRWHLNIFRRAFGQELIHFFNVIYFCKEFGIKKILMKNYCQEVERARSVWNGYYNILLKAGEIVQFNKMKQYIKSDSLEIGCGNCRTTNIIFKDIKPPLTFGCEYFMDNFINEIGSLHQGMYKKIKHYVGGSIKSLPFKSNIFNSIMMVHIIDHILNIDDWFNESRRILKPGGYLLMTGYSKNIFNNFPGVKFRKIFSSKWSESYKNIRIFKQNPRGNPFISEFEHDAAGLNAFSEIEWKQKALTYGFELVDCSFFGKYFSYLIDVETRGYYNSLLFNRYIIAAISEMVEQEKIHPLLEKESANVILVFKKVHQ